MQTVKIAFRNLNRQKKRTFLLGGAIAFGMLIITMINGFTGSFVRNAGENFSHLASGHIFVEGYESTDDSEPVSVIRDDSEVMKIIEELNMPIQFLTKRSDFMGTLIFQGETCAVSPCRVL